MNFKAIYRNANERNAKKIVEKGKILKLTLMFGIQYRCVVVSYATTNELFPTIPTHTHTAIGVLTPSSSQMRPFKHMRNSPSRRERKGVRERGWEREREGGEAKFVARCDSTQTNSSFRNHVWICQMA